MYDPSAHVDEAVSAVLYSCSRSGLYNEAISIYQALVTAKYHIKDTYKTFVLKACKSGGRIDLYNKYSDVFNNKKSLKPRL
jgi:hypothetical protein